MIERDITLTHKFGLHGRPSLKLATEASKFASRIEISFNGDRVDAKSMLNLLSLGVPMGGVIRLYVEGADEMLAADTIADLVHRNFDFGEDH